MFERFTDRARRVVVLAQDEARGLQHSYIGTEHLLLGLITEGEGVGARALAAVGLRIDAARAEVERRVGRGEAPVPVGHLPFTPRAKAALESAMREALQLGHTYIGTEHILLGLMRDAESIAAQVLAAHTGHDAVRATVMSILGQYGLGSATPGPAGHLPGRYSPGLRAALEAAEGRAGTDGVVGTQHLLSVIVEWDDLAAHRVLQAGGFDATRVTEPIQSWDVAGTRDETPEQWGIRVTDVKTEDGDVVLRFTDDALRARVGRALETGGSEGLKAILGQLVRDLEHRLPPA